MNRYEETFDENNGESSGPKIIDRQIGVLRAQKEYEVCARTFVTSPSVSETSQ